LLDKAILEAKRLGYMEILLDCYPFFRKAIELYMSRVFVTVEKYNDMPEDFLFFGLKL